HYVCHRLLCLIFPDNNKLTYALFMMISVQNELQVRYGVSSKTYESIRKELSLIKSKNWTGRKMSVESIRKARMNTDYEARTAKMDYS
ncbi:hypothetical protein, partial [Streptococcus pneumoniae]|uniref:hypothetical protein n=1 Tax=Streptococcus pneumoniae TaxID=1313 RepID=UPI001E46B7EA